MFSMESLSSWFSRDRSAMRCLGFFFYSLKRYDALDTRCRWPANLALPIVMRGIGESSRATDFFALGTCHPLASLNRFTILDDLCMRGSDLRI